MNITILMTKKITKPHGPMKNISEEMSHYESNPHDVVQFIERMLCLGYTYSTIVDQACLKYKIKKNLAESLVKQVRTSWIEFSELADNEKRSHLEQQLNLLFRMCLDSNELGTAAITMKRKMELCGISTSNTGRGSINNNVNIGSQGLTAGDILPADLLEERKQNLLRVELEAQAKGKASKE